MAVGSSNRSGGLCKLYGTTFNKSWRHCKPCDEINSICLMYLDYLDVCVTCAIVGQMPSSTCQVLRVCLCVSWMVCDCCLDSSWIGCVPAIPGSFQRPCVDPRESHLERDLSVRESHLERDLSVAHGNDPACELALRPNDRRRFATRVVQHHQGLWL